MSRPSFWSRSVRPAFLLAAAAAAAPLAAQTLAVQLVDPAGVAATMNPRGDVVGTRYSYPCQVPGTCLPEATATVWTAAGRLSLPAPAGLKPSVSAIAADGTVVGTVTDGFVTFRAAVWRLSGGAYTLTEIGSLGLQQSYATDVDASGRVVGYATTPFVATRPFVWTTAGGLVDLAAAGAPAERIFSVSPGGRVLTDRFSFQLDAPATAQPLPAPPAGAPSYFSPTGDRFRTNDQGDLGGFLLTVSQSALYLFRWQADTASWQQLDTRGIFPGSGLGAGVGRITEDGTIAGTVGRAVLAQGPDGLAQPLSDRLSAAYPPNSLSSAGYFNDAGVFVANFVLGGVARAVKLVPVAPCVGACLRVSGIAITGTVVPRSRRNDCGQPQCTLVTATLTVTDASGNPQPNVRVGGRFMNSYTLDGAVTGRTGTNGTVTLKSVGFVGSGTVALLVESAVRTGWSFDRSVGTLTATVIPR
jgi:hypothetical protein